MTFLKLFVYFLPYSLVGEGLTKEISNNDYTETQVFGLGPSCITSYSYPVHMEKNCWIVIELEFVTQSGNGHTSDLG